MLFNSIEFVIFFNILYVLYWAIPHSLRNSLLVIASYFFYCYWNITFGLLIVVSTLVDYISGLLLAKWTSPNRRRLVLLASLLTNIGILFYFKYFHFVSLNLIALLATLGIDLDLPSHHWLLPVGISFYTFQTLSYTIDVYRRDISAERNFIRFSLYVAFFPQLVAGPIERAKKLIPQFSIRQTFCWRRLGSGLTLVLWGLFLKVAIADQLAPYIDTTLELRNATPSQLVLAIYGFTIQLFCDFAGYSTMAIGIARTMGFSLSSNFDAPYTAKNMADFWKRWHITLSRWFEDYVFRPVYYFLQKKTKDLPLPFLLRQNLLFFVSSLITTVLLGFWHGADWGFGLFGLFHAIMIAGYHFNRKRWNQMPLKIQMLFTFHLFAFSCIFFRLQSIPKIAEYLTLIGTDFMGVGLVVSVVSGGLLLGEYLYTKLTPFIENATENPYVIASSIAIWLYGSTIFSILGSEYFAKPRQFIYFQF